MSSRATRRNRRWAAPTTATTAVGELVRSERWEEAEPALRQALADTPDDAGACLGLSLVLSKLGRFDESAALAQQLTAREPGNGHAFMLRGVALTNVGRYNSALGALKRALALGTDTCEVHDAMGTAYYWLGDLDQAVTHLRRAAQLAPDEPAVQSHLAVALSAAGNDAEARAAHDRACLLAPGDPLVRVNRALTMLADGDLESGWAEYDEGLAPEGRGERRHRDIAEWKGEPLHATRLLVYFEQGLGDELIFGSCYPDLTAEAAHLVVECRPRLVSLFARSFPTSTVRAIDARAPLPPVDAAVASGSVPRYRRRAHADFPSKPGYLAADPARVAHWKGWLATLPGVPVGVSWRSGLVTGTRRHAYPPLEEWGPVFSGPGTTFVCLQYDDSVADRALVERRYGTKIVVPPRLDLRNDLDGVAALAAALGVVVSVDNAVAAIAGSIGARTLLLTPSHTFTALGTDHWPWLPAVETFERHFADDWQPAMRAVAAEVESLSAPVGPRDSS